MSSDPPPPYPGGPSAPLLEEKNGQPPVSATSSVVTGPPQRQPLPPEYGPPPYEATVQPGFVPPHVPGEGAMPKPMAMPMPMPHPHGGYYPPHGHYPHPMAEHYAPGPSHFAPGHTATVITPPGAATTVTVLQGEMFQSAPVQMVCPHCQQPIITRISHDIGLMNTLFCLFCFFVGCDLGCCLIPCMIDELKDVTHTCPNCKGYIYTYKRIC
ncbi:cell death-inducing p53-target protein 1-like isoform X2 [Xyrauchen texanus]|uniref:cell death-inducing p53-target protein 1-like isoform X2 n=1 Tax=Xyrauchen texanus TaxID=154827 RepID=UPI00224193D0|nr:cell death-inducing p53-target protein 1-like isoform X2 [Xyrauchen texanus]